MSLNAINPTLGGLAGVRLPNADPGSRIPADRARVPAAPMTAPQPRPATGVEPRQPAGVVPAEAPAGTDPELWAVLTTEERAFFAKAGAMGPLTYGHVIANGQGTIPVSRGGRLDVRA